MIRQLGNIPDFSNGGLYPTYYSSTIVKGGITFKQWVDRVVAVAKSYGLKVDVELHEAQIPGTSAWASFGVFNVGNLIGNSAIATVGVAMEESPEEFASNWLIKSWLLYGPPPSTNVTTGGSNVGATYQTSFTFQNLTTGNTTTLAVGDTWKITIKGAPGGKIRISGTKNGEPFDVEFGTIPSSGVFEKIGQPNSGDVGNWVQRYSVDGNVVGTLVFTVVEKRASEQPGGVTNGRATVGDKTDQPPERLSLSDKWVWIAVSLGAALVLFGGGNGRGRDY